MKMKQTEIGLIPDDWNYVLLKDVAKFQQGYQIYFANQTKYKLPGFDRYLYITDFYSDSNILFVKDSINYYHISKKDICIANTGASAGKAFRNKTGILSNNMFKIFLSDKLDEDYAWCFFNSPLYEKELNEHLNSTGQPHVGHKNMGNMQIPVPPTVAEQQRIAKALSDVDALISTTEKLIQKKKNIKQGTMQNLLTGKKRLPGFALQTKSPSYKQTELGPIPEDWEVKSLGEIFEFRPNNTFTRDCLNDSKGKYQNVHYGDVLIKYPSILDCSKETIPFINEGINVKFSKYGIVEGDIIIADTAEDETVGKVVEVFNLGEKKIVSGLHTFLCRKITDDFAPKWLGYFMNQAIFHNQLLPFITGTKVSAISRAAIQNVKVLIPSKEEQTAIANVLSSMDKEIETLNIKLEKYRNLKTAMMQQLLTGKIRL